MVWARRTQRGAVAAPGPGCDEATIAGAPDLEVVYIMFFLERSEE
jgi:hypothetical protein